jgi:SAM-dependent methyltransferase
MNDYILQVGGKGFDRLKFLNDVFGEHSRNFLLRAGLAEGMRVLEIGCGTGSMTIWLARQVGINGEVIAIDASKEQLEIARTAAEASGITNIQFLCSTIEALDFQSEVIDLAYCRFFLMHVKNPKQILHTIKRNLKPGGVIACEEPHADSLTTTPRHDQIEKFNTLFIQLGQLQGLDFNIGDTLFSILQCAGFADLHGCFIQPVISMAKALDFVIMGAEEMYPFAVKSGLVDEVEAHKMLLEIRNSECLGGSYYTFPRQAQMYGYKYAT